MSKTFTYHSPNGDIELLLGVYHYSYEGSLCIYTTDNQWGITKCLSLGMADQDHAFLDVFGMPGVEQFVEENGLAKPTGQYACYDGRVYPLYKFDGTVLDEIISNNQQN